MRSIVLLLTLTTLLAAEDQHLTTIRDLLVPMRERHEANLKVRGATPALTQVKHELIVWVETRLPEIRWKDNHWELDPIVLQEKLNDELERAGLFCGSEYGVPCPDWSRLGFLGRLVFDMKWGILVVKTGVGIANCGEDQSAYGYESADERWQRFWHSEQTNYSEDRYSPQRFDEVAISLTNWTPGADKNEHLILTLGHYPWCTSNWQTVYYRVWHTKSGFPEPKLLLDGNEEAQILGPIRGTASLKDVSVEYPVTSLEGGFWRPEIRHYSLTSDKLERREPVALSPRHFIAFWLRDAWTDVEPWTDRGRRSQLREWRTGHTDPFSEFSSPTLHCTQHPDQWQVSTAYGKDGEKQVYFLIRWRPPYRFTMLDVGDKPWAYCTEEDPVADEERDLFPGR